MQNNMIEIVIGLTLAGSIGSCLLLLCAKYFKKYLAPKTYYSLWVGIIILFLVPIPMSIPVYMNQQAISYESSQIGWMNSVLNQEGNDSAMNLQQQTSRGKIVSVNGVFIIWLLGMQIILMYRVVNYKRWKKQVVTKGEMLPENVTQLYDQVCKEMKVTKRPLLIRSTRVDTPLVVGLYGVILCVPQTCELGEGELRYIFKHELTHYQKHHLWMRWIGLVVQSIHWFNPLVYLVNNEIGKTCEWACDAVVVEGLDESERKAYIKTIIHEVSLGVQPKMELSTCMGMSKDLLVERFTYILDEGKSVKYKRQVALLIGVVTMAIATLGTSFDFVNQFPVYFNQNQVVERAQPLPSQIKNLLERNYKDYPQVAGSKSAIENGKEVEYEVALKSIGGNEAYLILSKYENQCMEERITYRVTNFGTELVSSTELIDFLKFAKADLLAGYKNTHQKLVRYEVGEIREMESGLSVAVKVFGEGKIKSMGKRNAIVEEYTITLQRNKLGEYSQMKQVLSTTYQVM